MIAPVRYTPGLLPPEQLEALFVGRHRLAARIVDRITSAATSRTRNHSLIVGPQGAGKTHLLSVLHHRTRRLIDEGGVGLATAWLDADPWLIHSLDDLLQRIVERLEPSGAAAGQGGPVGQSGPVGQDGLGGSDAAPEETIRAVGAVTPIVVFVENLDVVLDRIDRADDQGQHRLRHLLQDSLALVLVATSTRLSRDVEDSDRPFYGFFTTDHLRPLAPEQGAELLARLAEHDADHELAGHLVSDGGQQRLAVVERLAGGQPRTWATVGTALTTRRLDTLVDHLLARLDDLTPRYRQQIAQLSPQQQRVVVALAEADRPTSTRELSDDLGVDQRSLSKTMHDLVGNGWIAPSMSPLTDLLDRRLTHYDLVDPLVRVALHLSSPRRVETLRVVVEFLKGWLSASDVDDVEPRLVERVAALFQTADEAIDALDRGDPAPMFALPSPIRAELEAGMRNLADPSARSEQVLARRLHLHDRARALVSGAQLASSPVESWVDAASLLVIDHAEDSAALANATAWQVLLAAHRLAVAPTQIASVAGPLAGDPATDSSGAAAYWSERRFDEALAVAERRVAEVEQAHGIDHPDAIRSRHDLAVSHQLAGQTDTAIAVLDQVVTDSVRVLGAEHPHTVEGQALLGWLRTPSAGQPQQSH